MKGFLHLTTVYTKSLALGALSAIISSLPAPLLAESTPVQLSQNINFQPPDVEAPNNRQGGTHRGDACQKELSIIPLIPDTNFGLTLAASPTFLAYVSGRGTEVEFTLQTEDEKATEIYKTTFKVDKPGIVEVTIPTTDNPQKTLQVGQRYQWSFAVICNSQDRAGDYFVNGSVQRIEPQPSLKTDLATPDPIARLSIYANNGIWYETVANLAQLRRQAPDDAKLTAEWTKLLQSQKLDAVMNQPLVQSF